MRAHKKQDRAFGVEYFLCSFSRKSVPVYIIMLRSACRVVSSSSKQMVRRSISNSIIRTGGAAGGPMMPPFGRLKPPSETVCSSDFIYIYIHIYFFYHCRENSD